MAIIQISKLINKTGNYSELPQLEAGELGWATDQRRLFVGNKPSSTDPLPGNTEIITQSNVDAGLGPIASINNLGRVQIGAGLLIDEFGLLTSASISVASANGFSGSIATSETNSTITLTTSVTGILKGNGTAISSAIPGTDYQVPVSLTTTGSSGTATFSNNTLNIPQYQGVITVTTNGSGAATIANNILNIPQYQGPVSLTTSGTTGFATFTNNTLNIPQYQGAITLTTTGTSGVASFANNTLNIPQYQGAITLTTTGSGAATFANNTLNIPQYTYALPIASSTVLGGIKVGNSLAIDALGILSSPISVETSNGFSGSVTTNNSSSIKIATTVAGLLKGNGTAISSAISGTDYQAPLTLTTTGSSGAATFSGNTLNIPQYSGNAGTITTISVASANGFNGSVTNASTSPEITLKTTVNGLLKGNGTGVSAAVAGTDYAAPTPTAATSTILLAGNAAGGFTPISLGSNLSITSSTLNAVGGATVTQLSGIDNTYAKSLLVSGATRTNDAAGDTWIFADSKGSDSNKYGIRHNQDSNYIEFWGANAPTSYVDLTNGRINLTSTITGGISFNSDPGGGGLDVATIKYYAITGEKTVLEIKVENDGAGVNQDSINLVSIGGVGINNQSPSVALDVTGAILASGDITAFSDVRLKTNIVTIPDPLAIMEKLRGVYYDRIDTGEKGSGVIAQEIKTHMPMLVKENNKGILSVNHDGFSGLFIESFNALIQQVRELKEEIKKLKGE